MNLSMEGFGSVGTHKDTFKGLRVKYEACLMFTYMYIHF